MPRTSMAIPAAVVVIGSLACAGFLHPEVDFVEVDRHVAIDAGYTLPIEARAIFVRDRSTGEVRTTWFRYTLPPEPLADLREELAKDPDVVQVDSAVPPADWPDFGTVSLQAPDWWLPAGAVFRREVPADPALSSRSSGNLWAISEEGPIYVWMWSWEGWRLQPDRPVVGD